MAVTVSGCSDDLVEVDGDIREEFNPSEDGTGYLAFSDGTLLSIRYGDDGIWTIRLIDGAATITRGTDADDDYTDRAVINAPVEWVVFGERYEKAAS